MLPNYAFAKAKNKNEIRDNSQYFATTFIQKFSFLKTSKNVKPKPKTPKPETYNCFNTLYTQ